MTEKLTLNDNEFLLMAGTKFVGLDSGYPHLAVFHRAHRWTSAKSATEYCNNKWGENGIKSYLDGNEPVLVKVTSIEIERIPMQDIIDAEYEKELAELKKKYGK